MSYCRWSRESDVYVYASAQAIVCCACSLGARTDFEAILRSEMLRHLKEHEAAGHRVSAEAVARLHEEVVSFGDAYTCGEFA